MIRALMKNTCRCSILRTAMGISALALILFVSSAGAAPYAYITNSGSDNISVIDTAINAVVDTINVGDFPTGVAVNPAGTKVYVTNFLSDNISVIDTRTNTVIATVNVGDGPIGVAVNPDGTKVYVANSGSNTTFVIDTSTNDVVDTINVGTSPHGVAVNRDGSRVYVGNLGSNNISVIDTTTNSVTASINVGSEPSEIEVNPQGTKVYVANYISNNVSVIDTGTNTVIATVNLDSPWGVAVNPTGTTVYVTNQQSDNVSVIDTATNTVSATVKLGNSPFGVSVNPAGTKVYVTDAWDNNVYVIDTTTNTITAMVNVGFGPMSFGQFIGPDINVGGVPLEEWNRTFGGTSTDEALVVQQTSDGYVLAGYTGSYGAGVTDAWLIKTDANGREQWNKTFGGTLSDLARSVQQISDGYILAGFKGSYGAGKDFWLIKVDANGNEIWNRTFGGLSDDEVLSVQKTSDDGFILAGSTYSYGAGASDVWLIKTDASGNHQWNKTFGGTGEDYAYSIKQTTDGGYILAGFTNYEAGITNYDAWLIKTDASGNLQWSRTFGGAGSDDALSVQQLSDGYVLAGCTMSFGNGDCDFWLIKTDTYGIETWNRTFGGTGSDVAWSVQRTTDGGFILAGATSSNGIGSDVWLIKTDSTGGEQWNKTFGRQGFNDLASSVQQTTDGYILAGYTNSYGAGGDDAWLIKVTGVSCSVHNINKGTHYSTIQAAIDDASIGDEIHVDSGTYYENVNVTKQLILRGVNTGGDKPVVDGGSGNAIILSTGSTTLEGFIVRNNGSGNNGREGIIVNSNNNTIKDNIVKRTARNGDSNAGIFLNHSNNNNLMRNIISNYTTGIAIFYSVNNILNGNTILNYYGFSIRSSNNNTIYDNYLDNNYYLDMFDESSSNIWNTTKKAGTSIAGGPYMGGNYWVNAGERYNWTCADPDRDGICNSPFVIDLKNTDFLPLTLPYVRFINGTVKDSMDKIGIAGVKVSTNTSSNSTITNASGFYSLAVTSGTYNVTAMFEPAYYTNTTTVSTIGVAAVVQDIEIMKKPTGNISGSISAK